ncbi:hypothetical protein GDO81_012618 [Engystomops pustulosus]|uniref:Uncharacterized protein n=1 Tax=Engystomops pustulosus TaxID=76066 RepID=A0AAV7B198_ENGPU|nr:hypothetical protein GDO81_012618 [Engystomops pustulosus]
MDGKNIKCGRSHTGHGGLLTNVVRVHRPPLGNCSNKCLGIRYQGFTATRSFTTKPTAPADREWNMLYFCCISYLKNNIYSM